MEFELNIHRMNYSRCKRCCLPTPLFTHSILMFYRYSRPICDRDGNKVSDLNAEVKQRQSIAQKEFENEDWE